MILKKQNGFAHPLMVLLLVAVVAVVGFAALRVTGNDEPSLSQENEESSSLSEELPEGLTGLKSIEEIEEIVGLADGAEILNYKLESSNGNNTYVIELSDGRKIVVNAQTGELISEEDDATDTEEGEDEDDQGEDEDDDTPTKKVAAKISTKQAYSIAASRHSSPIKEIELEREDDKATYKIEYKDGSKIEIDATNGKVIKSDIKNDSNDDDDDEQGEDEDEDEDDDDDEDQEEDDDEQ